jgi:hypothetical protein
MTNRYISSEDMKKNSVFATHDSLIELGKQQEKMKQEKEKKILENNLLRDKILNFKNNLNFVVANRKSANSFNFTQINCYDSSIINEYIDMVNTYICILDSENNTLVTNINKLESNIFDLLEEKKETEKEYKDLDETLKSREKYWQNRVKNLREKCINKNTLIYKLNCFIVFITFNFILIKYYGFYNYVNTVYFSLYYPVFYLNNSLKFTANSIYYLLEKLVNLVLYLLLFDFIKVFIVYSVAMLCCIYIMRPNFN